MSDISVTSIQGRENSILSNESNISIGGFQPTLQISPHILAPTFGVDSNPQLLLEQLSRELTSSNAQLNTRVIQLIREAGFVSLWFYLKFIAGSAGPYNLLDEQLHLDMANFRQRVATTPGIKACGLVPRSCYKCLPKESLVLTSTGVKAISDLVIGESIYQWNGSEVQTGVVMALKPDTTAGSRLVTTHGRELVLANEHLLTDGQKWYAVKDLKVQDAIALGVVSQLAHLGTPESWCVGAVYGDGGLTGGSVRMTLADTELIEKFNSIKKLSSMRGKYGYDVVKGVQWWKSLGLPFVKSIDKTYPMQYFGDAQFLQGLFDSDGSVTLSGKIVLNSSSKELLLGAQASLLVFGIVSTLKTFKQEASTKGEFYSLSIESGRSARLFEQFIGFTHVKKQARLLENNQRNCISRIIDVLPTHLWKQYKQKGDTPRNAVLRIDNNYRMTWEKYRKFRSTHEKAPDFENLPLRWDSVKEITSVGQIDVVHIQVSGFENYIGFDGIIHHNSTIWSHGPNAWELLRNPNLRIGCTSQVYDRALSFVQTTISIFTDNDLHKLLYPEYIKENRSNVDLVLANRTRKYPESNLQAISAGSSTQGSHFDLFDCDDIVGEDMLNASHVAGADMARMGNWLFSNLRTLVVSWIDSRVMVVGTRYAVDDPYERIMKSSKEHIGFWDAMEADYPLNPEGDWVTYYRPAVQTDKDGNNYSVNPNAFNLKQLAELELSDPWVYQSQYANNPLAAGVSDFANYTIERFELEWDDDKETYEIVFLDKALGDFVRIDLRSCDVIVAGDPSGGTVVASYNSSRAAVVVLATDGLGRRFVLDVEANFVPPTKFFGWLFQYKKKYFNYCRGTFIEAQAAFKSFISILRKEEVQRGEWLNLVGINALGDKETTIRNIIQPLLDKGKLFLRHAVYVKVMEELRVFPSKKMDILDALKIAVYKSIVPRDKNYSIDDDDDDDRFHRKRSNRDHVNKTTGY